jgi:EAL domain-containing protein (putative c-di-GMP-specific phosphodiesterase class I)
VLEKVNPALVILDVSLVRNILYSPRLKKHVHKLIASLHERGLAVVTPQIEDVDVLPMLWSMGADYAQGYCLQPPSTSMNYEFMHEEEITLPSDRH